MGHVSDRWTSPDPARPGRKKHNDRWGHGRRWRARWIDPDGRSREASFSTKDAAEAHVRDMDTQVTTGTYIDPVKGQTRLGTYADGWLEAMGWQGVQRGLAPGHGGDAHPS